MLQPLPPLPYSRAYPSRQIPTVMNRTGRCLSQSQDWTEESGAFLEGCTSRTPASTNISDLPDEILLEILTTLKDLCFLRAEWFQVNLVCRRWRYIVVEAPSFWNRIPFWRPYLTPLMLERSKMSDLHVDLDGYVSADMVFAMLEHMRRIRSLTIKQDRFELVALDDAIYYSLGGMADRLEELTIRCTGHEMLTSTLSSFGVLPLDRLRRVTLSRVFLDWATLRLPNLTHLDMEYIRWSKKISLVQLIDTLRHMPRLETLRLPFNMLAHGDVTECPSAHLPHLVSLEIHSAFPNDVEYFLYHTSLPRIRKLLIQCRSTGPHPDADYTPLMRSISSTFSKGDFPILDDLFIVNNAFRFEEREKIYPLDTCFELIHPRRHDTESDFSITRQVVTGLATNPLPCLVRLDASDMTPLEFQQLFAGLPLLKSVSVGGDRLVNALIQGLKIEPWGGNLDDEPVSFPALQEITIHSTSNSPSMFEELYNHLESRYQYAEWRIRKLYLYNISCEADPFKKCVDEVVVIDTSLFRFND